MNYSKNYYKNLNPNLLPMIDTKLIESALWLTGKTIGNMEEIIATNIMDYHNTDIYPEFSIEKFC